MDYQDEIPDYKAIIADLQEKLSFAKTDYDKVPLQKNFKTMKTLEFHLAKWERLYRKYLSANPDQNNNDHQSLNLF